MIDIIIAHKASMLCNVHLARLLASIQAAAINSNSILADEIKIFIVSDQPSLLTNWSIIQDLDAKLILDLETSGIYNAYKIGFVNSYSKYCIFIGCDDLILDSYFISLSEILSISEPNLILFDYIHETKGYIHQNLNKFALVLGNWCQQAVVYKRTTLEELEVIFNEKYKIQADHDLNIRLMKMKRQIKIKKINTASVMFGAYGASSQMIDIDFKRDMHKIVDDSFGRAFGLLSRLRSIAGFL